MSDQQQRAPLLVRVLGVVVALALAGVLLMWGIDLGRRIIAAGSGEADQAEPQPAQTAEPVGPATQTTLALQEQLAKVSAERDHLDAAGATAVTALKQAQGRLEALQQENAQLAGDLAMEEKQLPEEKAGIGIALLDVRATMVSATRLQYGLLLAYGAKKARPVFDGRLQLTLVLSKDGKQRSIEFPDEKNADAAAYVVNVQHHQRIDGVLDVPDGGSVESLQIRLLEKGQVVARQSVNLKEASHVRP